MLPIINKFYFNQEKSIRTDKVFISFESAEVKRAVWKKYKLTEWKRVLMNVFSLGSNIEINGCQIDFEQAVEPNEIVWDNQQKPDLVVRSHFTQMETHPGIGIDCSARV